MTTIDSSFLSQRVQTAQLQTPEKQSTESKQNKVLESDTVQISPQALAMSTELNSSDKSHADSLGRGIIPPLQSTASLGQGNIPPNID